MEIQPTNENGIHTYTSEAQFYWFFAGVGESNLHLTSAGSKLQTMQQIYADVSRDDALQKASELNITITEDED